MKATEKIISFGKLIADTIDDAPKSYREFERNLLSDDAPGELGENCDEIGNEEEQYNDVNEHDVHFDISNEKETTIVVKAAGNNNDTFTVSDDTIENEVCNILAAITITISERETNSSIGGKNPILPPCKCKSRKCNIDEKYRERLHAEFWRMDSHARKSWLWAHVNFRAPKRRYVVSDTKVENKENEEEIENETEDTLSKSRRELTRQIWLLTVVSGDGSQILVCQKMFLSTLGYRTDKVLRNLQKSTDECDVISPDQRGRHVRKHKISVDDEQFLKQDIMKYKPNISHYRREHAPNRLYLPSELTVNEMYTDYKRCAAEAGQKILSYVSYWRQIKQMNISFAKLGVEECELCDESKIHINEKESPVADSTVIVRKKTRKNKSSDSTDVNKSKTKTSAKKEVWKNALSVIGTPSMQRRDYR